MPNTDACTAAFIFSVCLRPKDKPNTNTMGLSLQIVCNVVEKNVLYFKVKSGSRITTASLEGTLLEHDRTETVLSETVLKLF